MNRQEMFDVILEHLLIQGRSAVNEYGKCVYRASNGDRCAVGVLLSDELYQLKFDESVVGISQIVYDLPKYFQNNVSFLRDMQNIHDRLSCHVDINSFRKQFINQMRSQASHYNLEWKDWENWTPDRNSNTPKIVESQ